MTAGPWPLCRGESRADGKWKSGLLQNSESRCLLRRVLDHKGIRREHVSDASNSLCFASNQDMMHNGFCPQHVRDSEIMCMYEIVCSQGSVECCPISFL